MVDNFGGNVGIAVAEAVTVFKEFCCNSNARAFVSFWIFIFGVVSSTT